MVLDNNIINIIEDIKHKLHSEKGIDLSEEDIYEIVNSQFIGLAIARDLGISATISYIGTFLYKNFDAHVGKIKAVFNLKDKIDKRDYNDIIETIRIEAKKNFTGSKLNLITNIEDLPKDKISNKKNIYTYNYIYNKVLENE